MNTLFPQFCPHCGRESWECRDGCPQKAPTWVHRLPSPQEVFGILADPASYEQPGVPPGSGGAGKGGEGMNLSCVICGIPTSDAKGCCALCREHAAIGRAVEKAMDSGELEMWRQSKEQGGQVRCQTRDGEKRGTGPTPLDALKKAGLCDE
jgi:hypothetical protein